MQERVALALGADRRRAHVPRQHERVVVEALEQPGDRRQQRLVIAAGQIGAADRLLEQDVAGGEDGRNVGPSGVGLERVGDVAGTVTGVTVVELLWRGDCPG